MSDRVFPFVSRVVRRAGVPALVLLAALVVVPRPASAQGARFAMLVQGASGGGEYATLHRGWLDALATKLRDDFHYDADHLFVLAEQAGEGEVRSTAENVRSTIGTLLKTMGDDDQLIVVFIGHGTAQGADVKFNLVGPDLSVDDWKALLAPLPGRLAIVDTTSSSFPFLAGLSAPGRVVITATNSPAQRYHTRFPDGFIAALGDAQADLDHDGRTSLLEAFTYASRTVAAYYEQNGTMATEHAMLDDNGDGVGRIATDEGDDGAVAALTYFGGLAVQTSADPELQRLLDRQRALTEQIDALRRRESSMPADAFQQEFERLVLELSQVSAEVRSRQGSGSPDESR